MPLITPPSAYAQGFHTKAYLWRGIYVLGNDDVPDAAVYRAAEIVFNSISGLDQKIVDQLVHDQTRFAVIPYGTSIRDLPNYHLDSSWEDVRGAGGVPGAPTSSSGEENLLPDAPNDPYGHTESIGLHEWMHSIETIGLAQGNSTLHAKFVAAYNHAVANHLWENTYAHTDIHEYFAETAQSYFNNNPDLDTPNGIHNTINTRAELKDYDPEVYALHKQLFGNTSWEVGDYYGTESADTLTGTGGSDLIFGNGGGDLIRGGNGKDMLEGGGGTDTADFADQKKGVVLTLNGAKAVTATIGGKADDTLKSFENINGGGSNDTLTGDKLANALKGNNGDDQLDGGKGADSLDGGKGNDTLAGALGNDTLTGGRNSDVFVFNTELGAANIDVVVDLTPGTDRIQLDADIFKAIGPTFDAKEFYAADGAVAGHDKNDRIIYDTLTGNLYYDADGLKSGAAPIHFATLTNLPPLFGAGEVSIV